MRAPPPQASFRILFVIMGALAALALAGCAGLAPRDPVRMHVVGLEPLPGKGMEIRFTVKLRVQNPNESAVDYDGIALELELNGRPFATGVSDQRGSVPRFGETVIDVPVSVSTLSLVRQIFGAVNDAPRDNIPYVLRGKLAGGAFGVATFSESGTLSAPGTGKPEK